MIKRQFRYTATAIAVAAILAVSSFWRVSPSFAESAKTIAKNEAAIQALHSKESKSQLQATTYPAPSSSAKTAPNTATPGKYNQAQVMNTLKLLCVYSSQNSSVNALRQHSNVEVTNISNNTTSLISLDSFCSQASNANYANTVQIRRVEILF